MKILPAIAIGIFFALAASSNVLCQDAMPVEAVRVVEVEVKSGRRVVGTVTPLRTSTVGSAVDGRVATIFVNQGDRVRRGDSLAQLLTETLEIELAAAEAELAMFRHQLSELENGSRPEDIAEAKANVMSAKARMQNAANRLRRTESLATTRAATSADLDDAKQQYDAAKFGLDASEALLQRIEAGPRSETIARAKSQVALQEERRNLIQDRIAKCTIRAPYDGFVSAEFTEVGAWISQGDSIVQVIQLDEVEIQTPVPAEVAVHLLPGEPVRVEFPELPDELLVGTVERIVPIADARTRTFPVIVGLTNVMRKDTPMLLAGMLARVDLPAGKRQKLPLVPKDALVLNGSDRSVYVVDLVAEGSEGDGPYGTARKVPVQLGVAFQDGIQVTGGVRPGELVVVVGNERLVPNSKVRIVSSTKVRLSQ